MDNPSPAPTKTRRPWPMTWIVVAIVGYIATYTFINVSYRKPEGGHEPWAEAEARAEAVKQEGLLDWTRLRTTVAIAPADSPPVVETSASVSRTPTPGALEKALPIELVLVIPARPELAPAPIRLVASTAVSAEAPLRLRVAFAGTAPVGLGELYAFTKDRELHLFLQDETRPARDVAPLSLAPGVEAHLDVPAGTLEAGSWQGILYCADSTLRWNFTVE
ncbi:hypothetical protein ASA1KI_23680 [Opitutales bacterium ASA1]|uniref:hypothetical protein n=1 Tax=Congregicoccus parvus TaxID=3081749 RepID=UPI002B2A1BB5|nr:hypothetical protein ASA1KI_23680 [Opitutales bacterium ASA1]